jgi:hypothetical protein
MTPSAAVFAEVFVAGVQATLWLASLFSMAVSPEVLLRLVQYLDGPLATVLALAFCYPVGIVTDRLSDSVFERLDVALRARRLPESHSTEPAMRLAMMARNDGRAGFLNYARSRMRVCRVTTFNCTLLSIVLAAHLVASHSGLVTTIGPGAVLFAACLSFALAGASLLAWRRISLSYHLRLLQTHAQILEEQARCTPRMGGSADVNGLKE